MGWKPRIIAGGRDERPARPEAPPPDVSDAELTHRVILGRDDEARTGRGREAHDAFRILVERHQDQVLRLACHLLRDGDAARDVAQDVFLRAYRSLHAFRPEGSFRNWLLQITVNASRDHQGRQQRWRLRPLEEGEQADGSDLEASVATGLDVARLEGLLARLSAREREVFTLRDLEGLDVEEVARILALEEPTVRRHLARARLRLRALMAGPDGPEAPSEE